MEAYRTFIKNNQAFLVGHFLIYAHTLILMPLIIKTVGVGVYGGYVLFSSMIGFVYGISTFGVGFKCGRFLPGALGAAAQRRLFYPQFYFHCASIVVLSAGFAAGLPLLDRFFFREEVVFSPLLVFPFLFGQFLYSQTAGFFLSTHKANYFNYATVAFPYINIALIVAIYHFTRQLSVNTLFLTQTAAYLVIAIPLTVSLIRRIGLEFAFPDLRSLVEDVKLGFPLRVNYLIDVVLASSDRYLITYFIAVSAVGYYNPGYALGSLIILFPRVSSIVLVPLLSRAVDSGKDAEAHTMLDYTIKAYLVIALPFIAGIAVLSRPLLRFFANADVAARSYLVTPVIALATLFFGLNLILSNCLWVKLKTSVMLKMNAFAAMLSLACNVVLLHFFRNVLAAAVTSLISYATVFVFMRHSVLKVWPVRFEAVTIVKTIVASSLMAGVLLFLVTFLSGNASRPGSVILIGIVAAAVYIPAVAALRVFSRREINYLVKAFAR